MKRTIIGGLVVIMFLALTSAALTQSALKCLQADANGDKVVNAEDYSYISGFISPMSACSLSNNWCSGADVNHDGKANTSDFVYVKTKISCETKDADKDSVKDIFDICPNTKKNISVDSEGCSNEQFCSGKGRPKINPESCDKWDWMGNGVGTYGNPGLLYDCTYYFNSNSVKKKANPKCVATNQ